jgi:hypothetical protein
MRSAKEFDAVQHHIAAGLNDCAIARHTGIPRTTVRDWRRGLQVRSRGLCTSECTALDFSGLSARAYSYVLGLYLGDGCISRCREVWRLRVTLDAKYPGIIDRCQGSERRRCAVPMVA